MGEPWILMWVLFGIGLFVIGVAVYDYLDRKKRGQEIKLWKYVLVVLVGLVLMWPILAGLAYSLPPCFFSVADREGKTMNFWLTAAAMALAGGCLGSFVKKRQIGRASCRERV